MKKYIYIAIALVAACTISGCGTKKNEEPAPTPTPAVSTPEPAQAVQNGTIQQYFPFLENTLFKYEGNGSDDLNQQTFMMHHSGDKAQRFASNRFYKVTDVLRIENGELRAVYSDIMYYYENMLDAENVLNVVVIKEPLEVGTKWNYDASTESEITDMNAVVETPAGNYTDVMEITNINPSTGLEQVDYYARDVGLVKTIYRQSGAEISMVLKEIVRNTAMEAEVAFFGANSTTGQYETELRPLSVTTNMAMKDYFNEQLKITASSDFEPLLPEAAQINSIEPDWKNMALNIDLSKNYVQEMSVGAGIENMVLQCLANTLGNFYAVQKVQITLDGNPYESGHIIRDIGEYWEVEPVSTEG